MSHNLIFNPSRLTLARNKRGMTKQELAQKAGLTPRSISGYESTKSVNISPSQESLSALAEILGFPLAFFYGIDVTKPDSEKVSFRSFSRMTACEREAALSSSALALILSEWFNKRFDFPQVNIPKHLDTDPEIAAEAVRAEWGLGEYPIKNMIHLLESKGVRVFSLAQDTLQMNAFSFWDLGTPYVFLNTIKSSESSRFDAAHELGHLVLHQNRNTSRSKEAENEANAFASAFLMPKRSVFASAQKCFFLQQIIDKKQIWGVSASALAYRLRKVGILSEFHYTQIYIQMSKMNMRTNEPEPMLREKSQALTKIMAALKEKGILPAHIAEDLNINENDLSDLLFGLAPMLRYNGSSTTKPQRSATSTILKLVK